MPVLRIGLLFSRSGSYAPIAAACRAGALRGLREAGADPRPGSLRLEAVERDPAGEADAYAPLCAELIAEGARHIVGCVTSWSRKEVIPVLERTGAALWYPCPYEGFEASGHVVYAHAGPSRHLLPLLAFAFPRFGGRAFLAGSDYIWGWEMGRVARELVTAAGGEVVGERHLPLGEERVEALVEAVRAAAPGFVLNNLVGTSSYAFLRAMAALGRQDARFSSRRCPILSCNLTECELPMLGPAAEGLISAGPHFGSSSFEEAARLCVLSLARRAAAMGPEAPLPALLAAPDGDALVIDPVTQHAALPALIARVEGGAFRVLARQKAAPADPFLARTPRPARLVGRRTRPHLVAAR